MNTYLIFSAFTSRPASLLACVRASVFFFMISTVNVLIQTKIITVS
jgi:hypothetical protein